MDYEKLVGTFFHKLTVPEEQRRFKAVARNVGKNNSRKEFYFQTIMGRGHKPKGFVVDGDPTFRILTHSQMRGIDIIAAVFLVSCYTTHSALYDLCERISKTTTLE
jgi:hypothetical protein